MYVYLMCKILTKRQKNLIEIIGTHFTAKENIFKNNSKTKLKEIH